MTGKPNTDPPTEAHDSNRLGGEEPAFFAAAAALDTLDADLTEHAGSTSGVHGVAGTDTVAGQSDVDAVTSDLNDHEAATSGVHGVAGSDTVAGQSDVDAVTSDLNSHETDTSAHGANGEVFGSLDYTPESDVHNRYTDAEAAAAAPVQSVNNSTGNVSVQEPSNTIWSTGSFTTSENNPVSWGVGNDLVAKWGPVTLLSSGTAISSYFEVAFSASGSEMDYAVYRDDVLTNQL